MSAKNPSILPSKNERYFLLRRLHALSGVVPLGVFLLQHLYAHANIFWSDHAWNEHGEAIQAIPILPLVEIGLVAALLFHGIYGFYLTWEAKQNATDYPYLRNWMFDIQRWSGVALFFMIGHHIYHTRWNYLVNGVEPDAAYMYNYMGGDGTVLGLPTNIFYVVFCVFAAVHFANGLFSILCKWGIAITAKAQKLAALACFGLFLGLAGLGVGASIVFGWGKPRTGEVKKHTQVEAPAPEAVFASR